MRAVKALAAVVACAASFAAAASPQETAQALKDLAAFSSSFVHGTAYKSIIKEVAGAVPATVLASVLANQPSDAGNPFLANDGLSKPGGISQFATNPTAALATVSTPKLLSILPTSVVADILALETAIDLKQASIIRSDLGITLSGGSSGGMSSAAAGGGGGGGGGSSMMTTTTVAGAGGNGGGGGGMAQATSSTPGAAAPTAISVKLAGAAMGVVGLGIALL